MGTIVGNFSIPSSVLFSTWILLAWLSGIANACVIGFFSTMFVFDATSVCVICFVLTTFFQGLTQGYGSLTCSQRNLSGSNIKCSINSRDPLFKSLRIGSMTMRT